MSTEASPWLTMAQKFVKRQLRKKFQLTHLVDR